MALKDRYDLAADPTFLQRVQAAMLQTCATVAAESTATAYHEARRDFAIKILLNPGAYAPLFAQATTTVAVVMTDAGSNPPNQASVTDPHIQAAVDGSFNVLAGAFA